VSIEAVREILEQYKQLEASAGDLPLSKPLAELRKLFASLEPEAAARILDQLAAEELLLAWGAIDDEGQDEILHEVLDSTRDALAARSSYLSADGVVNAFELTEGRLTQTTIESAEDLEGIKPLWVDLVGTTKADRVKIGDFFGLDLPDPEDLTDIEASARFYVEDDNELHLHSDFLLDREGHSRNVPVAFILYKEILFSVREEELPVFRLQRLRARTQTGYVSDGMDLLLDLYAADAEYSADALEDVYVALGLVGKKVLSETMTDKEQRGCRDFGRYRRGRGSQRPDQAKWSRHPPCPRLPYQKKTTFRHPARRCPADNARYRIAGRPHCIFV